tara:strand:+ start:7124 stop:7801 length:678 start_codon:yes stop_codon:yes gene_type:complete
VFYTCLKGLIVKLAIVQPNFFPYKSYYDLAKKVDKFIFLDDTNYNSKNWVNKTLIKLNSSNYYFRIPVDYKEGKFVPTKEIKFKNDKWKNKFLKLIRVQYKNEINFNLVYPLLEEIINLPIDNVCHISAYSVFRICDQLNFGTEFTFSSISHGNIKGKYHDKIVEIAKKEKADTYYTFARHKGEFNESKFLKTNIKISYFTSYSSNFSIIDDIMSNPIYTDFLKK